MSKNKVKKYISCVLFTALLVLSVCIIHFIFMAKESSYKTQDFFTEKGNIDVMFFGSSHVENFFSPLDLWNEYGITAYNFGNPEEPLPVTYQLIRNVVYRKKPKVIVLDASMFNSSEKYDYDAPMHYALDSFPVTKEKLNSINDIFDNRDDRLGMLFTLSTYHSRWKNIGNDHKDDINYFMQGTLSYGHVYTMGIEKFASPEYSNNIADIADENIDIKYVNKIAEYCSENDIELIFVSTPYILSEHEMGNINYLEQFANDNNIPFVNYNRMGSVIDSQIDLYNVGHVNQSGLHKVTTHFGSYLKSHYNLIDYRNIESYGDYYKKYDTYKALKYESILSVDSLQSTLMLLHDKDISSFVYISNPQAIISDSQLYRLMQNINRENLTVESDSALKSFELMPLMMLSEMRANDKMNISKDYLLISNDTKYCKETDFAEFVGEDAYDMLSKYIQGNDSLKDVIVKKCDAFVIVCDKESGGIMLAKAYKFDDGFKRGEIVFDNAPKGFIYK